jgi:hypothetical protein
MYVLLSTPHVYPTVHALLFTPHICLTTHFSRLSYIPRPAVSYLFRVGDAAAVYLAALTCLSTLT